MYSNFDSKSIPFFKKFEIFFEYIWFFGKKGVKKGVFFVRGVKMGAFFHAGRIKRSKIADLYAPKLAKAPFN